jgi:hypothetical protein
MKYRNARPAPDTGEPTRTEVKCNQVVDVEDRGEYSTLFPLSQSAKNKKRAGLRKDAWHIDWKATGCDCSLQLDSFDALHIFDQDAQKKPAELSLQALTCGEGGI